MKRLHWVRGGMGTGLIALSLYLPACAGDPTGIEPSLVMSVQTPQSVDEIRADVVARAFALAMANPSIRSSIRDVMRASLITEHKIHLAEFVRTSAGRTLASAAALRIGLTPDSMNRIIAGLPPIDFYVPSATDRRGWKGEASFNVGYAMRGDRSRYNVYDATGRISLHVGSVSSIAAAGVARIPRANSVGWTVGHATFLLQPAERTSKRIDPQPLVPGLAIEDPNDGQISGSFVEYLPNGTIRETQLADYFAELKAKKTVNSEGLVPRLLVGDCTPDNPSGCGGGSDVSVTSDTTFLENVIIISVCDNGDCYQGNEFEWHTYFSTDNGSTWGNRYDLRVEGVGSTSEQTWHYPALFKKPRISSDRIQSDVVETDTFSPNDHFDPSPQWSYQDNFLKSEGDSRCGYPRTYGGTYDCFGLQPFPWKEVNQNMTWHS